MALAPNNPRAKPSVILVHGAGNSKSVWRLWERELAEKGWNCLSVDLRGHGRDNRDLSRVSMSDYADDVSEALLSRTLPQRRPIVMGWSMGGLIAMMCAQRGLASACVCLAPSTPSRSRDRQAVLREGTFGAEAYGIVSLDPADQPMMKDLTFEEREIALASLCAESQYARDDRYAGIVIESLPCPLLIVTGTEDTQWPRAKYDGLWLDGTFTSVAGASHWGLVLSQKAVRQAASGVDRWLITQPSLEQPH